MPKNFKEFAVRGNVIDMAVGIIVGVAFGAIVKSLVDDILMPPIGLLLRGVDPSNFFIVLKPGAPPGPYAALANAKAARAVTINYGVFLNVAVSSPIIALAVFLFIRGVSALRRQREPAGTVPTTRECPYCATGIPLKATRCPQ